MRSLSGSDDNVPSNCISSLTLITKSGEDKKVDSRFDGFRFKTKVGHEYISIEEVKRLVYRRKVLFRSDL